MEAYVTVTDASGRILFRRAATPDEVAQALAAADEAEQNAQALMTEIAIEREQADTLAADGDAA